MSGVADKSLSGSWARSLFALTLGLTLAWVGAAWGAPLPRYQIDPNSPPKLPLASDDPLPTSEQVAQLLAEVQAQAELDEAIKAAATQLLQTAQKKLDSIKLTNEQLGKYEQMTQAAAEQLKQLQRHQKELPQTTSPNYRDNNSEQLKQALLLRQSEWEQLKKEVAELTDEPARRLQRASEIPQTQAAKTLELNNVLNQLKMEPPANESPILSRARRTQLLTQRGLLERELANLTAEQKAYSATDELLPLQLSVTSLKASNLEKEVGAIQAILNQRQSDEAQRLLDQTRTELARAPAPLRPWAERNFQLAQQRAAYIEQNKIVASQLEQLRTKSEEFHRQYKALTDRVTAVGLTEAMGLMIKQQRMDWLKLKGELGASGKLPANIRELQLMAFDLKDELGRLLNDRQQIDLLVAEFPAATPAELRQLQTLTSGLVTQRRALLPQVITAGDNLFRNLFQLDTEQKILDLKLQEGLNFIDQRMVWIPSGPPLGRESLVSVPAATQWLISPENWWRLGQALWGELRQRPSRYLPSLAGLILLGALSRRFKRILREAGEAARKGRCSDIAPTWQAVLSTALLAALWPLLALTLAWLAMSAENADNFVSAFGFATLQVAFFLFPAEVLRNVARNEGLGVAHFDWPERLRKFLWGNLRWFNLWAIPSIFAIYMFESFGLDTWKNSLGRFAAIFLFLGVTAFMQRLWRPEGVFFQNLALRGQLPTFYRFRSIWFLAMISLPIFLIALLGMGYSYTALVFAGCLLRTAGASIILVLFTGVAFRFLLMRRRQQAIEESRKARLVQAASAPAHPETGEPLPLPPLEQPTLDLATVNRQAREMVFFLVSAVAAVWLYMIWRDVLPAIGLLDQTVIWQVAAGERFENVTLKDLLFATIAFGLTFLMIKNMPGLLNLLAQQYSTLDSGTRYAATAIFRYLITVIGIVIGLSFLKINWGQYSWLVAAVTVGLGFGLQEIVANFVSGLILLFERPVRVGDLVTIDDTTGVVTRIQMRATTVTNWDNQELIVPNKALVTGKLLNWTLSSLTTRLVLQVGVAYRSDPQRVQQMLTEVVARHPDVLKEPPVSVTFEAFGESALQFTIRCFLPSVDKRVQARHELNTAIFATLKAAKIDIPFPQREIHVVERNL